MGQVEELVARLNLGEMDGQVTSKAKELERLMALKVPNLKKAENARPALAVEFACKHLFRSMPRSAFVQAAGVSQRDYTEAYQKCCNLMGLRFQNNNTIEVFRVKYGSNETADCALSLLEAFKQQDSLKFKHHALPDYNSPLYHGAAFVAAAKRTKLNSIKRDTFFSALEIPNKAMFNRVCSEIESIKNDDTTIRSDIKTQEQGSSKNLEAMKMAPLSEQPVQSHTQSDFKNPIVKRQVLNSQVDVSKSFADKEQSEYVANEKKRKNLEIYEMWKSAVLHRASKHNCE